MTNVFGHLVTNFKGLDPPLLFLQEGVDSPRNRTRITTVDHALPRKVYQVLPSPSSLNVVCAYPFFNVALKPGPSPSLYASMPCPSIARSNA
jgi:hypothetical protein